MQPTSQSNKDDLHFPKVQPTFTGNSSRYRLGLCLSLVGVLVFLGLCFTVLPTFFSSRPGSGCAAAALNANCQPRSRPVLKHLPSHGVPVKRTSTSLPRAIPKRALTPTVSPSPSPTPSVTALTEQQEVTHYIEQYERFIVSGELSDFHKAYDLLSPEVQDQEPFSDFVKNANYTLPRGCLIIGDASVTQAESQTWDASLPVTKVSCVDGTAIVYYSWHFRVHLVYGLPEIVSIGLYPVAAGG